MKSSIPGTARFPRWARALRAARLACRRHPLLTLALLASATLFAWNVWRYHGYLLDDTYISLRYARNFAEGRGLVYNPGERVEGYTNFLLVAISALLIRLGIEPDVVLPWVSLIASIGVVVLCVRLERQSADDSPFRSAAPPLAPIVLLPLQAFAYWSVSAMEMMTFTFLVTAGIALGTSGSSWAPCVFALAALARPEGVWWFAALSALTFGWKISRHGPGAAPSAAKRLLRDGAVFGLLYGAYFAWRVAYYGKLVPNTFTAKVTGGAEQMLTGLRYLGEWCAAFPLPALALAAPLALFVPTVRDRMRARGALPASSILVPAYAAYLVFVGGDFMPFFRFFVPVLPLVAVWTAWAAPASLGGAGAWWRRRGGAAPTRGARDAILVLAFATTALLSCFTPQPYRAFVASRTAIVGQAVGRRLGAEMAPGDWIAVNTAGAVPYASRLNAIDMLGLTDDNIANRPVFIVSVGWAGHRRGWGRYVLDRRPRVIVWYNAAGSFEPYYLSDHEMSGDPVFRFFYTPRRAILPSAGSPGGDGDVIERFLGDPFGETPPGGISGRARASGTEEAGDLGVIASFSGGALPMTTFAEGPVRFEYFEFDSRLAPLWPDRDRARDDAEAFLGEAANLWERDASEAPAPDPAASSAVAALCRQAYEKIQAHDLARARALLERAERSNAAARSPLVYQYMANLAALAGDRLAALSAQKEAFRLSPRSSLYRENLRRLLTGAPSPGRSG